MSAGSTGEASEKRFTGYALRAGLAGLTINLTYQSFEELEVWKRASRLAVAVYRALEHSKDFGLRSQMTRAAVSVPSNIAEGYERGSNKEFVRYLNIAKGSAAELRTQLYIAREINELPEDAVTPLIRECKELSAMLHALARSRKNRIKEDPSQSTNPDSLNPEP